MKDPIAVIEKVLDKFYSYLLHILENDFIREFGFLSPSVTGVTEAIDHIKNHEMGIWGQLMFLEGDFEDLYSNCNKFILIKSVNFAMEKAKFSELAKNYIHELISCVMEKSFFHEPGGIFKFNLDLNPCYSKFERL